jgi:hypothetical protein
MKLGRWLVIVLWKKPHSSRGSTAAGVRAAQQRAYGRRRTEVLHVDVDHIGRVLQVGQRRLVSGVDGTDGKRNVEAWCARRECTAR